MNYITFNRQTTFNEEVMDFHSDLISDVQSFQINNGMGLCSPLTNMLFGIWDGCLYDELLESSKVLPMELQDKVQWIIKYIKDSLK
jgi:hypothetical protein